MLILFHFKLFLALQTNLVTKIQGSIKKAYMQALQIDLVPSKKTSEFPESDLPESDSQDDMLQHKENFHLLLSTIVWFMEHDLYTNIALHLDTNFLKVKQEDFRAALGTDTDIQK